jgi:ADP-ribosylglycohydrolase/protein tyrosine phosphatase (PTP) superfamily phosphohydrolase (DUF442 family)
VSRPVPFPDSYWVVEDRLLAGEYPFAWEDSGALAKVRGLVAAGVTLCVNLTEGGEYGLRPYHETLAREAVAAGIQVRHIRMDVPDMSVPSVGRMRQILDVIEDEVYSGGTVYVHCFGGIGRTGTVVGCFLVERGFPAEEAIARIALLRQGTPDGRKPSPETGTQREFVRRWHARCVGPSLEDRYIGCLLGGAVGDALGAPIEFLSLARILDRYGGAGVRDFGAYPGGVGAITDDTQMTLFTAEGLIRAHNASRSGRLDNVATSVHQAYLRWLYTQGEMTLHPAGRLARDGWMVGIRGLHVVRSPGTTCLSALVGPVMGTTSEPVNRSKGCGGVMRAAPAGLLPDGLDAFGIGCDVAAITHGHASGYLAAGMLAQIVREVVHGRSVRDGIAAALERVAECEGHAECVSAVGTAMAFADREIPATSAIARLGQGWIAEEALAIGLYCALVARDFTSGVALAVNHGGDSDSTGSIAGNVLGALFGKAGIPRAWIRAVDLARVVETVGLDLYRHFGRSSAGAPDDRDRYPG